MEFSENVLEGLKVAASSDVSDKLFASLLSRTLQNPIASSEEDETAVSKEAYSALAVLLYEAARVDADSAGLNSILEDCQFSPHRSKRVTDFLIEKKANLRSVLDKVGRCVPHVVDVKWRLDYCVKGNRLERINQPEYLVSLTTQQQNEAGESDACTNDVQFACSQEQLQDLVLKLKDATKSLDKFVSH